MRVLLKGITKKFGELKAIDNASLTIEEGDFFTLLGPSGCGKTTLLRTVAGFYSPDEGTVTFGDRIINDIPAHKRETGMVFQNYALFPHLSVFDNIAYGLRARKVSSGDIKSRVMNILKSVQLEGLE
ncbi:MAG TPA: ATP-binding cassette domain-containing protein, partial [Deltaproteobacteria bacterium]|nr:ATP-binding cassette domain-containing protein [Deltaproteobacteria bacterium]